MLGAVAEKSPILEIRDAFKIRDTRIAFIADMISGPLVQWRLRLRADSYC